MDRGGRGLRYLGCGSLGRGGRGGGRFSPWLRVCTFG